MASYQACVGDCMVKSTNVRKSTWFVCGLIACILCWVGCDNSCQKVKKENAVIGCPGVRCMDMEDFSHELSLKLAAYPYDIKDDPDAYNQVVIDLAANLAQQYQLLCGAKKQGIHIPREEVDTAEKSLREMYSDEDFQHLMLKEAVRYRYWKKKIKQDLMIREYIRVSLLASTSVTQDEIGQFYAREKELNGNEEPEWLKDTQTLILRLKEKKAGEVYDAWVEQLKETCPATINREILKKFLILPSGKDVKAENN